MPNNSPQAQVADNVPELRNLLEQFQFQCKRYDEISTGVSSFSHRLRDTNFPQNTKESLPKESPDGMIYELRKCVEMFSSLNDRTEQTLSKFNSFL